LDLLSERLTGGPNWRSSPHRNGSPMPRSEHWLDSSLEQCLAQNCDQLPTATALMIINLTGSIRSLERQINEQAERLQFLYKRLEKWDPGLTNECYRSSVVSLSNDGVLVRDEVA
jgi:hypothetical protein